MNKFIQHIPTFVDGCTPQDFYFNTLEELEDSLKKLGYLTDGLSLVRGGDLLMQINEEGDYWWVLGRLRNYNGLSIRQWKK